MSLLAYLFLSLIYNEIHKTEESVSLPSTVDSTRSWYIVLFAGALIRKSIFLSIIDLILFSEKKLFEKIGVMVPNTMGI